MKQKVISFICLQLSRFEYYTTMKIHLSLALALTMVSAVAGEYTVASGDSLGTIARKYHITTKVLRDLNHLADPNRIYIGQKLATPDNQGFDKFIHAIHKVEASGHMRPKDGDHGAAIGPFQIRYEYWADATNFDPSLGGRYQDCRDYDYAVQVVNAYLRGWASDALKNQRWATCARIHNGGPHGQYMAATNSYWNRVKRYLAAK